MTLSPSFRDFGVPGSGFKVQVSGISGFKVLVLGISGFGFKVTGR